VPWQLRISNSCYDSLAFGLRIIGDKGRPGRHDLLSILEHPRPWSAGIAIDQYRQRMKLRPSTLGSSIRQSVRAHTSNAMKYRRGKHPSHALTNASSKRIVKTLLEGAEHNSRQAICIPF
jgi:hypothetical protein